MKKTLVALMGLIIFLAGVTNGSFFDLPNSVSAFSASTEEGRIELVPGAAHQVKWKGQTIKVLVSRSGSFPVRFKRVQDPSGEWINTNLTPAN